MQDTNATIVAPASSMDYLSLGEWSWELDFARTDWTLLWEPDRWRWEVNVTPLSQPALPFYAVLLYLLSLVALKSFMANRKAYDLKYVSAFHNLFLCAWSLVMALGTIYYAAIRAWSNRETNPWQLVCETEPNSFQGPIYYFGYLYYISKYYELLDSVIILLKKKPLIFLHVYHHAGMVVLCRLWMQSGHPIGFWTVIANSLIHVWMYYFYFLAALGQNVWWKKYLTIGQMIQFAGLFCVCLLHFTKSFGQNFALQPAADNAFLPFAFTYEKGCVGDEFAMFICVFFDASLFLLFNQFFQRSYTHREADTNPSSPTAECKKNR
ncbi:Elongation of very long chain fatty acids protein [Balamuthia mandrillaris]